MGGRASISQNHFVISLFMQGKTQTPVKKYRAYKAQSCFLSSMQLGTGQSKPLGPQLLHRVSASLFTDAAIGLQGMPAILTHELLIPHDCPNWTSHCNMRSSHSRGATAQQRSMVMYSGDFSDGHHLALSLVELCDDPWNTPAGSKLLVSSVHTCKINNI